MSAVAADARYMYQFQYLGVQEIGKATEVAARLQSFFATRSFGSHVEPPIPISDVIAKLETFYKRYRQEWETANGNTPDAIRFRRDLFGSGDTSLLEKENRALLDIEESLRTLKADEAGDSKAPLETRWSHARQLRRNLAALYAVNLDYTRLANQHVTDRTQRARNWLFTIGILGTLLTLLLGTFVQRAIAPRIRRLVTKVNRFREFGVHEQMIETGKDEISLLAHALDTGFAAIATRDREREEFLAVAAHELKTPITSIHGYSKLLIDHPERASLFPRALEIIHRQSWRLTRLVEHLFLAMRARAGELHFDPKPLNLSTVVQHVLAELGALISNEPFTVKCKPNVMILGDEVLLEHALWSLFASASALSQGDQPIKIALDTEGPCARVTADVISADRSAQDIETLFMPFHSVQYENGSGIRSGVGLYLCREIVRVHCGRLNVRELPNAGFEFSMELAL
jgi:signal transduction histidine kinase